MDETLFNELEANLKEAVNLTKGSLSRTATRVTREWTDLHVQELEEDWKLARKNMTIKKIEPLK